MFGAKQSTFSYITSLRPIDVISEEKLTSECQTSGISQGSVKVGENNLQMSQVGFDDKFHKKSDKQKDKLSKLETYGEKYQDLSNLSHKSQGSDNSPSSASVSPTTYSLTGGSFSGGLS